MARVIWSTPLLKRHKLYELASPLSGKSAAQHVEDRSRDLGIVGGAEMAVGVGDMRAVVIDLKRWFGFVGHQSNPFHFSSGLLARRCGSVLSRPRLLIGGLRRLSPRWFKRLRSATSAAVLVLWCAARSIESSGRR